MSATMFYEVNVAKQREIINQKITVAMNTGDPVIMLPFDTYPIVEDEMVTKGWGYEPYEDKVTGKQCASFYPEQYYRHDEDEE